MNSEVARYRWPRSDLSVLEAISEFQTATEMRSSRAFIMIKGYRFSSNT
jgi:hypothetical protein